MSDELGSSSFEQQLADWIKQIGEFQKKITKLTWLSIAGGSLLGIIVGVLLNSFVFNRIPNFYYGWLIWFIIIYGFPFIVYYSWAFPKRKKFIKNIVGEINFGLQTRGFIKRNLVTGLVHALPNSGICRAVTRKIDSQVDREVRTQFVPSHQNQAPQSSTSSGIGQPIQTTNFTSYDQLEYIPIQTPFGTTRIQFVCPACFEPNEVSLIDIPETISSHVGDLRVRYSGQSLRTVSSGMAKWGMPIIISIIVFIIALLLTGNFQTSCVLGIVIGFFGGFLIIRPILEGIVGSVVSKKTPIWLVACKVCRTEVPFATVNGQVGMGKLSFPNQTIAGPVVLQPKAESHGFRMPIDNIFIMRDRGAVVSGVVRTGSIQAGMPVSVIPKDKENESRLTEILWIKPFGENELMTMTVPGDKVNILLKDLGLDDVHEGDRLESL